MLACALPFISAYAADVAITVDTVTDVVNRKVLFTNTDNEYIGTFTATSKANFDNNDITNIAKVAFTDGTVQTTAGGVGVGDDLYYEGGSVKMIESDVPVAALYNNAGHMFIDLQDGAEKIMYEASATNMDIALGMIYGKTSGQKFLDLVGHNIYGAGGQLNIELDVDYEIRDSVGDDVLRFSDGLQALMYDGGTVKAFDLAGAEPQIKNWADTKILDLFDVGLFGENANLILGMSAVHGYTLNDSAGNKFIDLADGSEAIYWGAGAFMFFDPVTAMGINYNDGSIAWDMGTTYSIHGPAAAGIAIDLANFQLQVYGVTTIDWMNAQLIEPTGTHDTLDWASMYLSEGGGGAKTLDWGSAYLHAVIGGNKTMDWANGLLYDPTDGTTVVMDWNERRLTNIVNVAFADGTVQTTAYGSDPYNVSDAIAMVVNTGTLSRADGAYRHVKLTQASELIFDTDFPTNGLSVVSVDVYLDGHSLTLNTNNISGTVDLTLATNAWENLIFLKSTFDTLWYVRQ